MNKAVSTLQELTLKPGRQKNEQKIIIQCDKFYHSSKQDRAAKPSMKVVSAEKLIQLN